MEAQSLFFEGLCKDCRKLPWDEREDSLIEYRLKGSVREKKNEK